MAKDGKKKKDKKDKKRKRDDSSDDEDRKARRAEKLVRCLHLSSLAGGVCVLRAIRSCFSLKSTLATVKLAPLQRLPTEEGEMAMSLSMLTLTMVALWKRRRRR